jgi:hypothetical protein
MPEFPLVGDLSWVETDDRLDVWRPLPQERGLAIAGWGGNERDRFRSVSSKLEKPLTSDDTVLRDSRPSVEGNRVN